jgi:chorismate synthase
MSGANTFGSRLSLTTFGESHGVALGAVLDGVPAGVVWNQELLLRELDRRKPGSSAVVSARAEGDEPEVLSGVFEGQTLGTPIAVIIRNRDTRSEDYKEISQNPRTGHADQVWKQKFGMSDHRGGGRSSGRETVSRVIGGAIAKMLLSQIVPEVQITGFVRSLGPFSLDDSEMTELQSRQAEYPADEFVARFPSSLKQREVEKLLLDAKAEGHSYGGVAEIWIDGLPVGLGQPVFRKLKSDLAAAFMSVGATSGFEIGAGFSAAAAEGSQFHTHGSDGYGGLRGGISTGERIILRTSFKPTSSVLDVAKKGRHDPCIVPRAVPVLEAMAALVIADHLLWMRSDRV